MEWMFLFVSSILWLNAECGGKLSLKLVSFSNSRGKGANGHYCDGKFFIRGSDCDHRFIICLDVTYGPQNTNVCKYGRIATATTFNRNHITFGSRLGGTANPMVYSFNKWPGSCKVKIDVYDDDDNRDDYVDFLHAYYYKFTPDYNQTTARATDLKLRHRVTLNIEMRAYCDEYYYGRGCDVYCKATDKYTCSKSTGAKICSDDWTGVDCNVKKDACISTPCLNKATCHNSMGSFLCVCPDGYTGTLCANEIDECMSLPCQNNGTCTDLVNSFQCICPYGYSGPDCGVMTNLCINKPCLNEGLCQMDPNDVIFHCVCPKGWKGKLCDIDVDECAGDICHNGATCENMPGAYQCDCANGWTGDKCDTDIDECLSSKCMGNSTCQNENGSFTCLCQKGYNGKLCDIDINECLSSPCLNGGICHDEINGFVCVCTSGYTGATCDEEIDECAGNPCFHNGSCYDLVGSFMCYCDKGWTGNLCDIDIDECHSSPCHNQGTCLNIDGGFLCQCSDGWEGTYCQDDVNECHTGGCQNGGTCSNINGGFRCTCLDGYTGETCSEDVDECLSEPCANGSTCSNTYGGFHCACIQGFTGVDCSYDINECSSSPCNINATCVDGTGYFQCICTPLYEGSLCENKINFCKGVNCSNKGVCIMSDTSHECRCNTGFTGEYCQEIKDPVPRLKGTGLPVSSCNGTNGEIVIYLDGKVTPTDRETIVSSVKRVVNKYSDIGVDSIEFDGSEEWLQDHTGASITNVTFSLFINGTKLCGEDVQALKALLAKEENKLAFKLYHGDVTSLHRSKSMVGRQWMSQTTWYENNWYLVMIAVVLVVLATGVLCFVLVRYKRRTGIFRKSDIYSNNSFVWQPGNGTSHTLPSLAFDNDLYQSVSQENQASTGRQGAADTECVVNQESESPQAYENDICQQPITGEQTKLMTYDPDRFDND